MGSNTTDASYWLNWRFLLCAVWVLSCMAVASVLIWRYEGSEQEGGEVGEGEHEAIGTLYEDESWRPCLTTIHPAWLLAFRGVAFSVFVALLVVNIVVDGGSILYYYTQWTFLLVTVYFGLGLLLSAKGCHQFLKNGINRTSLDAELGTYAASSNDVSANNPDRRKNPAFYDYLNSRKVAGLGGYLFQIIYQIQIAMHSTNVVFLLGDTALNSLRFPWFRIAYFMLWTSIYVIFQWIIHACVSIWWPYPFLDLSLPHAPIWYFIGAVLQVPCYAVFPLIIKLKHSLLMRWFPQSCYLSS
ncbi:hypothetical protein HPP92_001144 [Vanilla planifolia]|uniref:Uncharacterized protein n=1 Tax=Vanilla planifolia TaxID=51239 RepID=A0A835SBF0_VANPL|nr:hypothetical protein HPP92_001144 [Vanilla planifolia]